MDLPIGAIPSLGGWRAHQKSAGGFESIGGKDSESPFQILKIQGDLRDICGCNLIRTKMRSIMLVTDGILVGKKNEVDHGEFS